MDDLEVFPMQFTNHWHHHVAGMRQCLHSYWFNGGISGGRRSRQGMGCDASEQEVQVEASIPTKLAMGEMLRS
jgi:hypothetical protein